MQIDNSLELSLTGYELSSSLLKRAVKIDFYASSRAAYADKVHLLLVNDGQDLHAMDFKSILDHTEAGAEIEPLVVVAVHCGEDRINEYGITQQADFKGRGNKAVVYEQFLLNELMPFVYSKYSKEEINIQRKRSLISVSQVFHWEV
jgi:enterochelin esterase-like enzyme